MDQELNDWFVAAYQAQVPTKLDMGKSCIHMKNPKNIPYELIGDLVSKMSMERYIELYEKIIESRCSEKKFYSWLMTQRNPKSNEPVAILEITL